MENSIQVQVLLFANNYLYPRYYFYFNPFILHFEDIKEIINLLKLKEIDNNYSYLNIHLGDLIND